MQNTEAEKCAMIMPTWLTSW